MKRVMVGCPVRDRERVIGSYMSHLLMLDYPREFMSLVFLVNNSTDSTEDILLMYQDSFAHQYCRFEIHHLDLEDSPPFNRGTDGRTLQHYRSLSVLRNHFISLMQDEDGIFSIDSDILVGPQTLKRLLSYDLPIVSALVENGRGVWNVMKWIDQGMSTHVRDIPDSLFEVDVTGACYWIHRAVIEAGVRYSPGLTKSGDFSLQGEDIGFCQSAQEKGFKIYCDPGVGTEHLLA